MELRRSSFSVFCSATVIAFFLFGPAFATDLTDAVRAGNVSRVVLLLNSGADPNKRSPYNGPLHDAARIGSDEITTILIRAGADLELPGFGGNRPLHSAAMAGRATFVSLLLNLFKILTEPAFRFRPARTWPFAHPLQFTQQEAVSFSFLSLQL